MFAQLRNVDRRLLTILLIIFVQIVGASMILHIMKMYAKRHFEMSPQVITLLVSAFFAAQFVAGPFLGRLSDTYGRLPVLIISQIGTVISFIMLGLATNIEMLFLARILDGITGGNIIVAQAYVTDITPKKQRTQALGYVFAAFGLGFIFGPATGGILSAFLGDRYPFLIAAIAATITLFITWYTLDETVTPEMREHNRTQAKATLRPAEVLNNYPLVLILLISFGGQFGFGVMQSTLALYSEAILFTGMSENVISLGVGFLLATLGIGQLFTQMWLLKRLLKRFDEARLAMIGVATRGFAMYVLVLISTFWLGPIATIAFAIGTGLMMPSLQSLSTETVADELRGGVLGLYQSSVSLSVIFSTAISGTLFAIGPRVPYMVGGTLFMLMTLPGILLVRWARSRVVEPEEAALVPAAMD